MPNMMAYLLRIPHEAVLREAASIARRALGYWPQDWELYLGDLERAVVLFEMATGLRPPTEHMLSAASLSGIDRAFLAVKHAKGPSWEAVLVVDALRAVARAFHFQPPRSPRVTVNQPTADEVKNLCAEQVQDASRLLDQLEAAGPPPEPRPKPARASQQRQPQRPGSPVSRAEVKARVRSSDPKARLRCPFCEVDVSARNLLQHCDQQHRHHYVPDRPEAEGVTHTAEPSPPPPSVPSILLPSGEKDWGAAPEANQIESVCEPVLERPPTRGDMSQWMWARYNGTGKFRGGGKGGFLEDSIFEELGPTTVPAGILDIPPLASEELPRTPATMPYAQIKEHLHSAMRKALERQLMPGRPMLIRVGPDRIDFWLEGTRAGASGPQPGETTREAATGRCKRCNHIGPPRERWLPFRGNVPVCRECGGELA